MRMFLFATALAAVTAFAPTVLQAQTAGAERAPLALWLRAQTELGLTQDQVTRLQGIQQRLQEQNRPLMEQLRASGWPQRQAPGGARERMQRMTPEQREQMRERMQNATPEQREQMRQQMRERVRQNRPDAMQRSRGVPAELQPVVQQLRENSRAAFEEARSVLTVEQRERVQELVRDRAVQRAGAPRGGRGFRAR